MSDTKRYYKISDNGVAFYFTTPEELQTFLKKSIINHGKFSIVDIKKISETCNKETEILTLNATFE